MPFPIRPPAGTAVAVAYLRERGFNAASKYRDGQDRQVVVTHNGSDRDVAAPIVFEARLMLECYAPDAVAAEDLALDTYAAVSALSHRWVTTLDGRKWWVQRADEVAGPIDYPDVTRQAPRWQWVAALRVVGTAT